MGEEINLTEHNLSRINTICVCCLKNFRLLEVHHIDGDRSNNKESNLICICKECHNQIHNPHKIKETNPTYKRAVLKDLVRLCIKSKRRLNR